MMFLHWAHYTVPTVLRNLGYLRVFTERDGASLSKKLASFYATLSNTRGFFLFLVLEHDLCFYTGPFPTIFEI